MVCTRNWPLAASASASSAVTWRYSVPGGAASAGAASAGGRVVTTVGTPKRPGSALMSACTSGRLPDMKGPASTSGFSGCATRPRVWAASATCSSYSRPSTLAPFSTRSKTPEARAASVAVGGAGGGGGGASSPSAAGAGAAAGGSGSATYANSARWPSVARPRTAAAASGVGTSSSTSLPASTSACTAGSVTAVVEAPSGSASTTSPLAAAALSSSGLTNDSASVGASPLAGARSVTRGGAATTAPSWAAR